MARRPRKNRGFTLIELLVVVAIIGITTAILIPNMIEALDKSKQKKTVSDIRQIGNAMMMWYTDMVGAAAAGQTLPTADYGALTPVPYPDLVQILVVGGLDPAAPLPQYIQAIPRDDAWGDPLEFGISDRLDDPQVLGIRSSGSSRLSGTIGVFEGPIYERGAYLGFRSECDIVWMDGEFVFFPEGKQAIEGQGYEAGEGACL